MKTVIVTGGTSGLGYELCIGLHKLGYRIVTVSRNEEKALKLKVALGTDLTYYCGDISNEDFVKGFAQEVFSKEDVVGVINNAFAGFFAMPTHIHSNDIEKCLKGVKGMMFLSAAALNEKQEKDIRIINILSTAAQKGKKMEAAYCMAKFAQRGYTEALKDAYQGTSVKVNGVYTGGMDTDLWANSRDYISEEKQSTFMDPSEVAAQIIDAYFVNNIDEDLEIKRK